MEYSLISGSRVRCLRRGEWKESSVLRLNRSPRRRAMSSSRRADAARRRRSLSLASRAAGSRRASSLAETGKRNEPSAATPAPSGRATGRASATSARSGVGVFVTTSPATATAGRAAVRTPNRPVRGSIAPEGRRNHLAKDAARLENISRVRACARRRVSNARELQNPRQKIRKRVVWRPRQQTRFRSTNHRRARVANRQFSPDALFHERFTRLRSEILRAKGHADVDIFHPVILCTTVGEKADRPPDARSAARRPRGGASPSLLSSPLLTRPRAR